MSNWCSAGFFLAGPGVLRWGGWLRRADGAAASTADNRRLFGDRRSRADWVGTTCRYAEEAGRNVPECLDRSLKRVLE